MKPTKLEVMPFGFSISLKINIKDYNKKIIKANILEIKRLIVAMSGPVTNLFIIIIINLINKDFVNKDLLVYSNVLIIIFNMLPIYPLDGGRILKSLIHIFFGIKKSISITNKIANIVIVFITFIGSIAVYYYKNIAIFLIIIFLWILVLKENKKYRLIKKAYNIV